MQLKIVCKKDGTTVEKSVDGAVGKSCIAATKFIEDALQMNTVEREFKPEYLQNPGDDDLLTVDAN